MGKLKKDISSSVYLQFVNKIWKNTSTCCTCTIRNLSVLSPGSFHRHYFRSIRKEFSLPPKFYHSSAVSLFWTCSSPFIFHSDSRMIN